RYSGTADQCDNGQGRPLSLAHGQWRRRGGSRQTSRLDPRSRNRPDAEGTNRTWSRAEGINPSTAGNCRAHKGPAEVNGGDSAGAAQLWAFQRDTAARRGPTGPAGHRPRSQINAQMYWISVSVALCDLYGLAVLCRGGLAVTTTLRLLHQVPHRIQQ